MYPQFVDFNADGHVDIFAATFDGSPHVAFGSALGFLEPTHILDPEGGRVMLTKFWNYEAEKWDTAHSMPKGQCTSALAFDWDADGDLDILMGDYSSGKLFRRMNEGTASEPRFSGPNIPVEVDGEEFELDGGLSSHQLIDWDGDGLQDLICGGYGDSNGTGPGAGIWLYRNIGKLGAPRFAAAQTLIPPSKPGATKPVCPDAGLYLDTVDWNGDGRMDLVVGGYSHWNPEQRELSPAEVTRVQTLETQLSEQQDELQALYAGPLKLEGDEQQAALEAMVGSDAYKTLHVSTQKTRTELDDLRCVPKREAFVWLYLQED